MGEEVTVRRFKAVQMMYPINDYLESLGLQEIIFPGIENVEGTRSYLMVYSPIFREMTVLWLVYRFLFLVGLGVALCYLPEIISAFS